MPHACRGVQHPEAPEATSLQPKWNATNSADGSLDSFFDPQMKRALESVLHGLRSTLAPHPAKILGCPEGSRAQ